MSDFHLARTIAALSIAGAAAAALAAGCGADQSLVGGSCAHGYTNCGNRCVDLETNPGNCGACGHACLLAVVCAAGVCGGVALDASPDATLDATNGDSAATDGAGDGAFAEGQDSPASDGSLDDGAAEATGSDGESADRSCPAGVYDTAQGCGDCSTVCSGATPICAPDDGGFTCAPMCPPQLTPCGNACVDSSSDAFNCGVCGNVCVSQICENARCVGATTGGIVFIGHDFVSTTAGTTAQKVLSNAVFIPQTNPLRVLSYERYADPTAIVHIFMILNGVAHGLGRTLQFTETTNDADIPNTLSLQNFDVFLVPDQPRAPVGALGRLGPVTGGDWSPTLTSFAQNGGVVVVLDGGTGVGEMPAFVTATGLLTVTAQVPLSTTTVLDDVARGDVEGVGLVSPYAAGGNSVSVTTEPNGGDVVYVVVTASDAGASAPVVVHKVF